MSFFQVHFGVYEKGRQKANKTEELRITFYIVRVHLVKVLSNQITFPSFLQKNHNFGLTLQVFFVLSNYY